MPHLAFRKKTAVVCLIASALAMTSGNAQTSVTQPPTDELQRRLDICAKSEPWLQRACLDALGNFGWQQTGAEASDIITPQTAEVTPPDELHLVGIYEPHNDRQSDGSVGRGQVAVHIDRPGRTVALVLGSYDPVRWAVTASPDTDVARIIIGGHGSAQSEAVLNGDVFDYDRAELPLTYRAEGIRFQPFHEAAYTLVGLTNADSFNGAYRAPPEGFSITTAPGVATQEEVNAALFAAARDRATLPAGMQAILSGHTTPDQGTWEFTSDGFLGIDATGAAVRYPVTLDVPDVSWPMGAAHDPENQLIWGISSGGEGYLYEYDIAADLWLAWSVNGYDAGGLIFDPVRNHLIATPGWNSREGYVRLDRQANIISSVSIPPDSYPGLINMYDPGNGPAPTLVPLAVEGDLLLVQAEPRWSGLSEEPSSLFYLVDLVNGSVDLIR